MGAACTVDAFGVFRQNDLELKSDRCDARFGLALDNVLSHDIVTADGKLLHATPDENAELYWGLRGGGGNFGVVTNFEFQLHPMQREVVAGNIVFPMSEAKSILNFYADYAAIAPDELYMDGGLLARPGDRGWPAEVDLR